MLDFLHNHPFPVQAHFEESLVLTFAVPKEEILRQLPPCLVPDTFQDRWAFIAVAMVQTRGLRPAGFPAFLGSDFFLTGYRVFVRFTNAAGRRLRGLYILKSETNRRKMEWLGNVFTRYRYQTLSDLRMRQAEGNLEVTSASTGLEVITHSGNTLADLPSGSPFADWKEARRFAGPLPFTFSWLPGSRKVLIVEGVRSHWQPEPVAIIRQRIPRLKTLACPGLRLASAFRISNVPYCWKKGRLETWKPVRKPLQGVGNIIRFNWPFFAAAGAGLSGLAGAWLVLPGEWAMWAGALFALVCLGVLVPLGVAFWIYDASGLYRMPWLKTVNLPPDGQI